MRTSTIYILGLAGFLILNAILVTTAGFHELKRILISEAIFGLIPVFFITAILHHPNICNIPTKIAFGWTFLSANWCCIILILFFQLKRAYSYSQEKYTPVISDYQTLYIDNSDTNFLVKKIIENIIKDHNNIAINGVTTLPIDTSAHLWGIELYHGNHMAQPVYSFWIGNKQTLEFKQVDSTQFKAFGKIENFSRSDKIYEFAKKNREHFGEKWFLDSITDFFKADSTKK